MIPSATMASRKGAYPRLETSVLAGLAAIEAVRLGRIAVLCASFRDADRVGRPGFPSTGILPHAGPALPPGPEKMHTISKDGQSGRGRERRRQPGRRPQHRHMRKTPRVVRRPSGRLRSLREDRAISHRINGSSRAGNHGAEGSTRAAAARRRKPPECAAANRSRLRRLVILTIYCRISHLNTEPRPQHQSEKGTHSNRTYTQRFIVCLRPPCPRYRGRHPTHRDPRTASSQDSSRCVSARRPCA